MRTSPVLVELGTLIRSLDRKPEAWRLPDTAQLAPVRGLPPVDAPTAVPDPGSIAPQRSASSPLLRPPGNPPSSLTKFLIASAIAVLLAGYFVFARSQEEIDVATVPQLPIDAPPSVPFAQVAPPSARIMVENKAEPEIKTTALRPGVRLGQTPIATLIEAGSPQLVPGSNQDHQALLGSNGDAALDTHIKPVTEQEGRTGAVSVPGSTCFPSASAVKENEPGAWPSWTLRTPGHEGTKCWYAGARRITPSDHQSVMLPAAPAVRGPRPRNGKYGSTEP